MGPFRKNPKTALEQAVRKAGRRLDRARQAERAAIARLDACLDGIGRSRGELLAGVKLKDLKRMLRAAAKIRRHQTALPGLQAARDKAGAAVARLRADYQTLACEFSTPQAQGLT